MKRKILSKVLFGYLVFAIFALASLKMYTFSHMKQTMEADEAERMYSYAVSIANNYGYRFYSNTITEDNLVDYLSTSSNLLNSDIWVISTDGIIVAQMSKSDSPPPSYIQDFDITEVFDNKYYSVGTFHSFFSEEYLSVYAPITIKYNVTGYIIMHKPISSISDSIKRATDISYQTAFIIILISSFFVGILIFILVRPIQKLCMVADEYAVDNFKPQISLPGHDELSYLGDIMSVMATKIDTQEESQRKFISNVSHDFKSPLTSIRGYIQAMLDGTIPTERYPKYLDIISNEADRLTQLTNNLLDLNRIGSRDNHIDIGEFDINEVIIGCAQSCEVQCIKKGITLQLLLFDGSLYVLGDRPKIQQVVYNLLDNAIKFSNTDTDSKITIETNCKGSKLYVTIKDEGIGIPSESINDIWHRFYKTDLSRGKDKKGTGLGLSIVKEIIQAHNETITVESTEGVGTAFTFSLPLTEDELEDVFIK